MGCPPGSNCFCIAGWPRTGGAPLPVRRESSPLGTSCVWGTAWRQTSLAMSAAAKSMSPLRFPARNWTPPSRGKARCRCRPTSRASARSTNRTGPITRRCSRARRAPWPRRPRAWISRETLTLHVGTGTFLPVTASDTSGHKMHSEWATLSADTAKRLNAARAAGGRIVAVGTTSLRTLETAAGDDGRIEAFEGETDIFITPGYRFKAVDVLLTNFHLPRSTLFMLVCAFAGTEVMRAAYAEAIRERYRFYSYGDACLLFRPL